MVFAASATLRLSSSRLALASVPGRMGFFIGIASSLLMVIFQIHVVGVASLKEEGYPPVGPYRHGPRALTIALQWVQSKRRLVHILHLTGLIERRKDQSQTVDLVGSNPANVVPLGDDPMPDRGHFA